MRKLLVGMITIFILGLVIGAIGCGGGESPKWEYHVELWDIIAKETVEDHLNPLGEQGWEFIYKDEDNKLFIFKRPY